MEGVRQENLILEKESFERSYIEKRFSEGRFNMLSKFEQFIWDLEIFLQLQKKLGEKIILKGGAATQFYIPVDAQRTSVDIDIICLATRREVHEAISEIEFELNNGEDFCKFRIYSPKSPKLGIDMLETYYLKVPSVCDQKELFSSKGLQEVKVEFMYSEHDYQINRIRKPTLFAIETEREFGVLSLEGLFADKLTTLGPATIGIPEERADEQFKQLYDIITLFLSNKHLIIAGRDKITENYEVAAKSECQIHNIPYDPERLFRDMKSFIDRVKDIENDKTLLQHAQNFQSLYLRSIASRDKAQWAITGFQMDMLIQYLWGNGTQLLNFDAIDELSETLKFCEIRGPERGRLVTKARTILESTFDSLEGLSSDVFKKRLDRIVWEIATIVPLNIIRDSLKPILST